MKAYSRFALIIAVLLSLLSLPCVFCSAAISADEVYPEKGDPFMGNWKGRWSAEEDIDPDVAAQVIPLGRDRYQIRLITKLFLRCPPLAIIEAKSKGDRLAFNEGGYSGEIKGDAFTGARRTGKKATFEMHRYELESPTLGAKPPEGAVVLFDGSNKDQWDNSDGWEVLPGGILQVGPLGSNLLTKAKFNDVTLHLEFCLPFLPLAREQQRGNSGVSLEDAYEVQVLDSFGLEGYYNECGALYKVAAPMVNACLPPLVWQTYDILYRAPRFNDKGELTERARMTVRQNGILIHNDQELTWHTGWKEKDRLADPPKGGGPLRLQAHKNYMRYRNIWLVENK